MNNILDFYNLAEIRMVLLPMICAAPDQTALHWWPKITVFLPACFLKLRANFMRAANPFWMEPVART